MGAPMRRPSTTELFQQEIADAHKVCGWTCDHQPHGCIRPDGHSSFMSDVHVIRQGDDSLAMFTDVCCPADQSTS